MTETYSYNVAIANGVDIALASKRAGHAKVGTALDIYCHKIKSRD